MTWYQKPPLGTPLDWGNPLNKGCVLHLACNEGMGDKVQDLSMYGNHGTLHNFAYPPTVASGWNPGQTGIGLNFDGTSDYIDCENNPILNLTDMTLSVIIKPDTVVGNQGIICKRDTNVYTPYTFFIAGDQLRFTYYGIDSSWHSLSYSNHGLSTDWQHVVVTFDDSSGLVQYYRNGVPFGNDIYTSSPKPNDLPVWIGNEPGYGIFKGSIDQPRIMNRAWSAKEVRDYYINPWAVYLME